MKAGIFLDIENLSRCGGYGMRFQEVRALVEAQGAVVLRANAYMAQDEEREYKDVEYRRKKSSFREGFRRRGFHLTLRKVQRYYDPDTDGWITKANADMELAIDALLQSENLDYILLGSGDGNFLRLVRALQSRGKRVDLLSFLNTSVALRKEVDHHFNGFLYPQLLPGLSEDRPYRGFMHAVIAEKGFGFLTMNTGFGLADYRDDVFLHINNIRNVDGFRISGDEFEDLKSRQAVIEFDIQEEEEGRIKAVNAIELLE